MYSLLAATLLSSPLGDSHSKWITLDQVYFPTKPPVQVVEELSGLDRTVLDVQVPGFLAQNVLGGDGKPYTRIQLPGWRATTLELGAPELPVLRFLVAVPPSATQIVVDESDPGLSGTTVYFDLADEDSLPEGLEPGLIYPRHEPAWDGDPHAGTPQGIPEVFHFDSSVFDGQALFPNSLVDPVYATSTMLGGVEAALVELRPFQWDPELQQLAIRSEFRVVLDHPESVSKLQTPVAKDWSELWAEMSLNYERITWSYPEDADASSSGRLLLLAQADHLDELLPLVEARQQMGLEVEFQALEELPNQTESSIRQAIGSWAQGAEAGVDSHVLLVGDVDRIPLHGPLTPNGVPSDAGYRRPLDDNPALQVFVGRLSIDDEQDLAQQIEKILNYQQLPKAAAESYRFATCAHAFDAPWATYVEFADELAESAEEWQYASGGIYTITVTVIDDDTGLEEQIALGLDALLYRGQGSAQAWPDWTASGDSLDPAQIGAYQNERPFVHYEIAPSTADLAFDDSLAEAWMAAPGGAAHVLGSAGPMQTQLGHEVGHWLGLLHPMESAVGTGKTFAATVLASELAIDGQPNGSSAQNLMHLGDPTMPLRFGASSDWVVDVPEQVVVGPNGGSVQVEVRDADGAPVDGVLVSLLIGSSTIDSSGALVQPPFQGSATTSAGVAEISFVEVAGPGDESSASSPHAGGVHFLFADGSVKSQAVEVVYVDFDDLGGAVGNTLGQLPRLQCFDEVVGGAVLEFELDDAPGFSAGTLFLGLQQNPVPYAGGFFHPLPVLLSVPFVTDAAGEANVLVGPLPPVLPPDLKLVLQAAVFHASGPGGILLSNGLAHTP